jgi:hypothetical protein
MMKKMKSNKNRMHALQNVLRISLAYYVLRFVFEVLRSVAWDRNRGGDHFTFGDTFFHDLEWGFIGIQVVLFLAVIVLLTRWMYRSYSNLGIHIKLRQNINMTVLSWFIPIWNWVGPFLLYSELVLGYESLLTTGTADRASLRRTFLKNWWWFTFIAAQLLWGLSFGYDSYNFVSNVLATGFFLSTNVFLLYSLSDLGDLEDKVAALDKP